MAYNTKAIKTDLNAKPIPQLYNPVTDEYEVLQGVGGAARQVLYGPDGQPISTTGGKLAVRAAELETAISNLQTALGSQSTAAKQDALAGLIGALDAVAVSDPTAAGAVIALLKGVLSRLQAVEGKIDGITDGTAPAKTQLTGRNVEEIVVFNALAIADTNEYYETFDTSRYKRIIIVARNTLNQNVNLSLLYGGNSLSVTTSEFWNNTTPIPTKMILSRRLGTNQIITQSDKFETMVAPKTRVYLRCDVAPTEGSISVAIWGVLN